MNKTRKNKSCKRGTKKRCSTYKKSYSKQLDCLCPFCLQPKKYGRCIKHSRLVKYRRKK